MKASDEGLAADGEAFAPVRPTQKVFGMVASLEDDFPA